jgi:hypothetical protein
MNTQKFPQPSLEIQLGDPKWSHLWNSNGFFNWTDAHGWLWDRYSAQVSRYRGGLILLFKTQETLTEFILTWGF